MNKDYIDFVAALRRRRPRAHKAKLATAKVAGSGTDDGAGARRLALPPPWSEARPKF